MIENVQIAPVGEYLGSDAKGNPVPERLTAESLQAIADGLNATETEVLADIDHNASKAGVEKDTKAAGWFTKFIVDPLRGLFATLKLTKHGRELVENREYRYISPTFTLNEDGTPKQLHTASLTNMPAFKGFIDPVLNTEAQPISKDEGTIIMEMTKEELVTLIKDTVVAMNSAPAEVAEEKKEDETKEACNAEGCSGAEVTEAKAEETAAQNCSEAKNEAPAEEVKTEEVKTEAAPAEVKEEVKKEEVITIEALNSAPTVSDVSGKDKWMNLHGDEFFKYLREHPEVR